jgi:hypothetical protein
MTTANLELCRELYELSGWEDTPWVYEFELGHRGMKVVDIRDNSHWGGIAHHLFVTDPITKLEPRYLPAYDLGYLLRKLAISSERNIQLYYSVTGKVWKCQFNGYGSPKLADIPEDCAAKLCIELFKQNILTRKDDL